MTQTIPQGCSLSGREFQFSDDPFPHLILDKYLPRDLFESLRQSFPEDGPICETEIQRKRVMTFEASDNFEALGDAWNNMCRYWTGEAFARDVQRAFFRHLGTGVRRQNNSDKKTI